MFSRTCVAWARRSPAPTRRPWASIEIWPAMNSRGPAVTLTLLEYAHASGVGHGRAARASHRAIRDRRRHTCSVRTTSPIRADMIFGKDKGRLCLVVQLCRDLYFEALALPQIDESIVKLGIRSLTARPTSIHATFRAIPRGAKRRSARDICPRTTSVAQRVRQPLDDHRKLLIKRWMGHVGHARQKQNSSPSQSPQHDRRGLVLPEYLSVAPAVGGIIARNPRQCAPPIPIEQAGHGLS